jgi:arginyl-tRNA synthetase
MIKQEQILPLLTKKVSAVLKQQGLASKNLSLNITAPENKKFGDYTMNVALQTFVALAPAAKATWTSPRAWAEHLAQQLAQMADLTANFTKIEAAGGGFINFYLSVPAKLSLLSEALALTPPRAKTKQVVVVEYSSPNIAKPFTVGHLRSTIIGDAVANLLVRQGVRVVRDNHLGDWGTQFGKQVVAIQKWGDWSQIAQSQTPIKDLVALYVKFHEEVAREPALEDEARRVFTQMELGNQEYLALWQKIINFSLREFSGIYQEMGVKFDENHGQGFGESFFIDKMPAVIAELKRKKLLKKSRGAQIVTFAPKTKLPPLMILKKDGSTLYATRDLATDRYRLDQYGPRTKIINEVGKEQSLYFRQIFALEELLGWVESGQRVHIGHGMYRFKDRKMSTRKGDVVWLSDVVAAAKEKVLAISKEKLSAADIATIAWGAIKWNDLSREPLGDIDFDLQGMVSLKGNCGPYLQYTVVRLRSIKKKAQKSPLKGNANKKLINTDKISESFSQYPTEAWSAAELALITTLTDYQNILSRAASNLSPQFLATYLFNLAQEMNNFYAQGEKIVGNPRLELLAQAVSLVLSDGLGLLGIQIPSKM